MNSPQSTRVALLLLCCGCCLQLAWAGPPFITDDPEPVEFRHWEVYLASLTEHDSGGWAGTAPHVEVNYGAWPDLQLHIITPLAFSAPAHGTSQMGLGDIELGAKYRFIEETGLCPQVGVFPLVEVPTGDADRGLGAGQTQAFLPVWLQKSAGPWTTYGGGGYWINPGMGNRDWWFTGWLLQYRLTSALTVGAELYHETAKTLDTGSDTHLNLGVIYDLTEQHHLMFAAGPNIQGASGFQAYLAYQWTFGPATPPATAPAAR